MQLRVVLPTTRMLPRAYSLILEEATRKRDRRVDIHIATNIHVRHWLVVVQALPIRRPLHWLLLLDSRVHEWVYRISNLLDDFFEYRWGAKLKKNSPPDYIVVDSVDHLQILMIFLTSGLIELLA